MLFHPFLREGLHVFSSIYKRELCDFSSTNKRGFWRHFQTSALEVMSGKPLEHASSSMNKRVLVCSCTSIIHSNLCTLPVSLPSPFWSKKAFDLTFGGMGWGYSLGVGYYCETVSHGTSPIWLEHCRSILVFISWKEGRERERATLVPWLAPAQKGVELKSIWTWPLTIWTRWFEGFLINSLGHHRGSHHAQFVYRAEVSFNESDQKREIPHTRLTNYPKWSSEHATPWLTYLPTYLSGYLLTHLNIELSS
jgi:hypothetical protein